MRTFCTLQAFAQFFAKKSYFCAPIAVFYLQNAFFMMSLPVFRLCFLLLALFICLPADLCAQRKKPSPPKLSPIMQMPESIIALPPDYDPAISYPLLVLMPYTGGSSVDFFKKYLREARLDTSNIRAQFAEFLDIYRAQYGEDRSFILMLTHGDGSKAHHNYEGFHSCIEQMERRLEKDLPKFFKKYSIDTTRVFIGGVSLGGDLSWALSLRRPHWLQGAIVMGSRCSYPPPAGVLDQLALKNYSFFMVMGMNESPDRLNGIHYARQFLSASGVEHSYREMPYLEHDRAPIWLFMEGIEYVMFQPHRPIDKITDSLTLSSLCQSFSGEWIVKKYQMEQQEEILRKGGGLWLLKEEQVNRTGECRLFIDEKKQLRLRLQHAQLAASTPLDLLVYLTRTKSNEYALVIPEQNIGNFKYKGISADIDAQTHAFWLEAGRDKHFSFDIEKFRIGQPNQRSTFSFFSNPIK